MTYHPLQCRLSHCVQTICHRIGNFLWKADIPTHQREKEREGRGEKRRKGGEEQEGGRSGDMEEEERGMEGGIEEDRE